MSPFLDFITTTPSQTLLSYRESKLKLANPTSESEKNPFSYNLTSTNLLAISYPPVIGTSI